MYNDKTMYWKYRVNLPSYLTVNTHKYPSLYKLTKYRNALGFDGINLKVVQCSHNRIDYLLCIENQGILMFRLQSTGYSIWSESIAPSTVAFSTSVYFIPFSQISAVNVLYDGFFVKIINLQTRKMSLVLCIRRMSLQMIYNFNMFSKLIPMLYRLIDYGEYHA